MRFKKRKVDVWAAEWREETIEKFLLFPKTLRFKDDEKSTQTRWLSKERIIRRGDVVIKNGIVLAWSITSEEFWAD